MMKFQNQLNLFGNGASLILSTLLAGFFGKGNLFPYHPKGPLISLQILLIGKSDAIYPVNLQPVFLSKVEYQPVWVK